MREGEAVPAFGRPPRPGRKPREPLWLGRACVYCGRPATTVDHVIPRSRGGPNAQWNLVPACKECNHEKGSLTAEEFLALRGDPGGS